MLAQLLPIDQRQALEEFGAIEFQVTAPPGHDDVFTVLAARGGDDVWLEVKRQRPEAPAAEIPAPVETAPPVEPAPVASAPRVEAAPLGPAPAEPAAPAGVLPPPPLVEAISSPQPDLAKAADLPLASLSDSIADEPMVVVGAEDEDQSHAVEIADEEGEIFEISLDDLDIGVPGTPPLVAQAEAPIDLDAGSEQEIFLGDLTADEDTRGTGAGPIVEAGDEIVFSIAPGAVVERATDVPPSAPSGGQPPQAVAPGLDATAAEPPVVEEPAQPAAVAEPLIEEPAGIGAGGGPIVGELTAPAVSTLEGLASAASAAIEPIVEPAIDSAPLEVAAVAEPVASEPVAPAGVSAPIEEALIAAPAAATDERPHRPDDAAAATMGPVRLPVSAEAEPPRPAVVLPLARPIVRQEGPAEPRAQAGGASLERILRIAAARGAATVYVVAQSQPMIRVDGEISVLDGEPALMASEVERLVMDLAPAPARDAAQHGGEWMADVPDAGRVRCVTFRDHRGPGVIFRMIPPKAISADQLGLGAEVQALCAQPDGLVLVAGSRASGKSTLLTAFVDLINRTRSDHVITIEPQIGFVHESRRSFISQREVRGDSDAAAAAVRSAFREDPDVLVIEDLRTPETVLLALEAAESGRLVFGSMAASSTVAAIDRLLEMTPADRRRQVQASLAASLRGVVAQVLLRKARGGRVAAREVLLNTPSVASLILEGKTFQLPVALESGRRHGMMPLAESLAAFVREGTVQAAEAYRKAQDRDALLAILKRDGIDTSFAERLA
jgi:twitching motility protein PilT